MEKRKVLVISPGHLGSEAYAILEVFKRENPDIDVVIGSNASPPHYEPTPLQLRPVEPLAFKMRPRVRTPWVDPKESVFNERKHRESCLKNRRKRKRRK
jgi:hypothetical protein